MLKAFKLIFEIYFVCLIIFLGFFCVQAFAQQCSTYYDQTTGRFCSICVAPGGTPVINCF